MTHPYKTESPKSIYDWGAATFGPRIPTIMAVRTGMEVAELVIAFANDHDFDKKRDELSDVAIMLWQLAVTHSVDARPTPSISFINPQGHGPLAFVMALNHAFSVYLERLVCKGSEPYEWLKKALMALEEIAALMGLDLPSLVDAKMQINRARTWKCLDKGVFQHATVAA